MDGVITKQLIFVARKAQLCIAYCLAPFGITAAEEPFFMAAMYHRGSTQEELTAMIGVDKAATARAIRSLESKGYLTRQQDPMDRRQNRVFATELAHKIAADVQKELLRLNQEILKGLPEQDLSILSNGLYLMEKNLAAIRGKGEANNYEDESYASKM